MKHVDPYIRNGYVAAVTAGLIAEATLVGGIMSADLGTASSTEHRGTPHHSTTLAATSFLGDSALSRLTSPKPSRLECTTLDIREGKSLNEYLIGITGHGQLAPGLKATYNFGNGHTVTEAVAPLADQNDVINQGLIEDGAPPQVFSPGRYAVSASLETDNQVADCPTFDLDVATH